MNRCPRCLTRLALDENWKAHASCTFLDCDSPECRALKEPLTLDDWKTVADHWAKHGLWYGCSHGR